ncbi:head maturation protease, ClpP-related [Marinobacter nauticus]|uniref:head maturation protease, ClpP-related n=1 Tax=Marinobacter nauticus TaxID=2743 RepID=UPI000EB1D682|nr:head maturation protease, ClpP-related [Marinobacter nauticus]RKR79173.1 ATP-dependent Clp endopeptidase proteolytic subunit ClpP [Marinobacter nauticus]
MTWFKALATGDGKADVTIDKIIASDWTPDWVVDFFGEKSARDFIEAIDALGDLTDIHLKLNTPGGDVYSGIRIANYLIEHKAKVHVTVEGLAGSIGSVILLSGDTRTMLLGSRVMTHKPSTGLQGWFTSEDLRNHADRVDDIESAIIEIYTSRTGKSEAEIRNLLEQGDHYMGADEALEWGFATAKSEKLKAVACTDAVVFEMQTDLMAAKATASAFEAKAESLTKEFGELKAELEAFKNPVVATADEVISMCAEAGLESMAVAMAKEKLPLATVEARLKLAAEVKDIAAAGGLDADVLMQHISNPTQMLRTAITEAKALTDQDLDHHHTPGPGKAKQPDFSKAYNQLNQR